ncbi:MAG: AAA family ATPase [Deltaproteobacteria bacterium]|jgi:SpoVK/Ycf46/Vps4 family AAA+-type ATPase|nr:AAA family ATPase [Deltaproteobacteria bacterium]
MPEQLTKEITYIRLPEKRIQEIKDLVNSWPYETKAFIQARLNQYRPPSDLVKTVRDFFLSLFMAPHEKKFLTLKDPDILTDWQKRFALSGQTNPQEAWNRILRKELSAKDYIYLSALLDKALTDIHVPLELAELFDKIYRVHIRKEYLTDTEIPRAPLLLFVGPSGSGKTSTVTESIKRVIFANEILPEIDLKKKKEALLAEQPFWKKIEEVDPDLFYEMARRKKLRFYKRLSKLPVVKRLLKRRIGRNLAQLEEQGLMVDYRVVTPNDFQTSLAGEPGNYFKKALGDPNKTAIRHVEEAHSAFGKAESNGTGAERQQRTLVDTSNIIIDEIASGKRDCLLIATTDQPERFDPAIYRRFLEKGKIIDLNEYWKNADNLKEVVRLELERNNIPIGQSTETCLPGGISCLSREDLLWIVNKLYIIFNERSLKITPAYVRKLIHSIMEIKNGFLLDYLDDSLLIRTAFELVAKNSYGDLFGKVVDRMDSHVQWEAYVGEIKNTFSEMANNCLFYGASEEKGVVLNGPPGGGKTFLARTWLSENRDVHDISTSPSALQDPMNPIDGAVDNLEKVYDIAKMIAPTMVFFDEGDALAPKRSPSGGSPSDKLTNKFLSLIDGDTPLNRVFTVLTTNRLDILDPALIRSKRLKVMEVSGHLRKEDISEIVSQYLKDVTLSPKLDKQFILKSAIGICNTPADYAAFVEKALSLRNTEYKVIQKLRALAGAPEEDKYKFVKFNWKTITGILGALELPKEIRTRAKTLPREFMTYYDQVISFMASIENADNYPLEPSHLTTARMEISSSPTKKGTLQLDQFLEAELSQEPQIGFIIGVGANDLTGVLLPIATSLTYNLGPDKIIVTGAVSSSAPAAAELDMAVRMTQQSAHEAFTLVKNYIQELSPKISISRLLGEFLERYTIHHQLLSASYNVGGPSAGYALAINTLSALLLIPVYNDFGITGAPWTKGVKKGEVGGSVIIGGHKKKTQKVLQHLTRMYMPLQNYNDLEQEFLEMYWAEGKDILGVTHFGDLVPEVLCLCPEYESNLQKLISLRIEYKRNKAAGIDTHQQVKDSILRQKDILKRQIESEIIERIEAIRKYLRSPMRDPHVALEEIFKDRESRLPGLMETFRGMLHKKN